MAGGQQEIEHMNNEAQDNQRQQLGAQQRQGGAGGKTDNQHIPMEDGKGQGSQVLRQIPGAEYINRYCCSIDEKNLQKTGDGAVYNTLFSKEQAEHKSKPQRQNQQHCKKQNRIFQRCRNQGIGVFQEILNFLNQLFSTQNGKPIDLGNLHRLPPFHKIGILSKYTRKSKIIQQAKKDLRNEVPKYHRANC